MNEVRERRSQLFGSRMDGDRQGSNLRPYQALLHGGDYGSGLDTQPYVGLYDRPLPCCGCGIGWCSFLMGFVLPLFWYYGTYRFFAAQTQNDLRERPGLAACAIAALVNTVALAIALIIFSVQRRGSAFLYFFPVG